MPLFEVLVREVMTPEPIAVAADTQLLEAALALRFHSIRHLPVVDGARLVGLLSERDILRCAPSRLIPITEADYNAVFEQNTVSRVMTREPICVAPDAQLTDAIILMQQARCGCLPVVEQEALVGIVTRGDLMDTLHRILAGKSAARFVETT